MWSNKQPTSGTALLGKNGRKLTIQSVLDVKDDTPPPKGASVNDIFNRSILILTPSRALKFTAISKERHYLWLTALSFLAHSSHGVPELGSLPAVPEHELANDPGRASLRRTPIRDSVLLSKNKNRPVVPQRQVTMPVTSSTYDSFGAEYPPQSHTEDAAEPPDIPRHSNNMHSRKRSSTGPSAPPPNIRSFSHNHAISSTTSASSDYNVPALPSTNFSVFTGGIGSISSITNGVVGGLGGPSSSRTSEASSGMVRNNFFEAVGTVRMEAFIVEPRVSLEAPSPHVRTGRRRVSTNFSAENPNRAGVVYTDDFDPLDPFKGF